MIWWAWGGYAWMTNAIDIESTAVRLVLLLGMAGMLFTALVVPNAYHTQGVWFVAPYLVVRLLHVLLYLWGLRHDSTHFAAFLHLAPCSSSRRGSPSSVDFSTGTDEPCSGRSLW